MVVPPLPLDREPPADLRRLVDELRESQRDLRRAQAVARTGSWRLDVRRNALLWSEETHRIFGIPPGDTLTYETFLAAIHPEEREAVDRAWQAALHGAPYDVEHRIVVGGTVKWVRERAELEFDAAGTLLGGFGTVQDVTERKQAEEALRESERRHRELSDALGEVDRRKSRFLAILSHELRNPLTPIRNSVYVLTNAAPGSEEARRAVGVIDRQVRHLGRMIDDLLDATRISSGKVRLQLERIDLADLAHRVVDDYRSRISEAGLDVEVRAPGGEACVDGDPVRLAQVLGNLLDNAVKFTPRGGRVLVSAAADRGAGEAVLRVRDSGAGLEPGLLSRLFEPFTQAESTLERTRGGLGLGLTLVRGLVELHGGEVGATSDGPGQGAELTVHLPLVPGVTCGPAPATAATPRARRRVLIIEDNVDAAETLRDVLRLGGHEIAIAFDGLEGIAAVREFRPDVVLCDIGLPGIDGYEVARRLRSDRSLARILLVALSGYAQPEDLRQATEAGFDQHLAKPPPLEKLEELLAGR
ncbi:MAG: response regulator [Deltaproteobacteria bacterium]|nr:response regulator [Deltaproteobacteria bacterium]